jgi:cyclophilin family peptidyl-prolyl cis-trans isomerase
MSRAAVSVIGAATAVLALAACGSSGSSTNAAAGSATTATTATTQPSTENQTTTAATETSATTAAAPPPPAIHVAGCRSVPPPPSRAGEQASKPTEGLDPSHSYMVRLETNCGPIVIQLAVSEAPKTTASFAHLVQIGYYNELTFHRVVPGFVIQGGDPNGNGTGGPNWEIVEPPPANLRYTKGTVAMAKGGTAPSGTSSSQFFIVNAPNVNLPPVYALVGHVVGSERAVEAISRVPTNEASKPRAPMVIEKATLIVH